MKHTYLVILLFFISTSICSQNIAPNFTVTDIEGNSHTLYDYLDAGKVVILDFYAVWCSPCQANTPSVESVYESLGPDGTDEVMILGLEGDDESTDEMVAQYAVDYNCSNPQINNTEDLMDLYNVSYYPTYFVVCPDRTFLEYAGTPDIIETELLLGVDLCEPQTDFEDDARIFSYNSSTTVCSNTTTPSITLMNMGQSNLTSLEMTVSLNGTTESTVSWTGDLALYEYTFFTFDPINIEGVENPTITIDLASPNGNMDSNLSNNSVTVDIVFGGTTFETTTVRLELAFDNFPQETSWEILNSIGEPVLAGDDYVGFPTFSPPIDTTITLPDDCYTFTIYDSFGDGICCNFADDGEGFWRLSTSTDETIGEGGVFLDEESVVFGISEPLGILPTDDAVDITMYPNPTTGTIYIETRTASINHINIINIQGQKIVSAPIEKTLHTSVDVSSLPIGIYFMEVSLSNGSILSKKIIKE